MKKNLILLKKLKEYDECSELATDEDYNTIDINDDPFLDDLIQNGKFFVGKGLLCDRPLGNCHKDVCDIYFNEKEDGDEIYTGYAQNSFNDEWFQHSFIVNNGSIVESGPIMHKAYFGVKVVHIKQFCQN